MMRALEVGWRWLMLLSPTLAATAFVLSHFVENSVPIGLLWRPLLVVLAATLVIQIAAIAALGSLRGTTWAFVIVCVACGMLTLAGSVIFALAIFTVARSRAGREYRMTGSLALIVAAALVMASAVVGQSKGAFDWRPLATPQIDIGAVSRGPSIHLLLLDGYPRQDELLELGFDNSEFLSAMEAQGFDVYADSLSNYDRTPFSVLTALSMKHLADLHDLDSDRMPAERAGQERLVARSLLALPLFDAMERAGYTTVARGGPIAHVPIGGADLDADAGTATNFELDLLQRSPLAGALEIFGFAAGQQRAQVIESLNAFADPPDGRSFTFTHVMSPHTPFVFGADGTAAPAPPCYPSTCSLFESDARRLGWSTAEYRSRLVGQVEELNDRVLEAVTKLAADDPEAVVVAFSDHGVRREGEPDALFRNLIVARTPGHPRLLGSHPTPINIVPTILATYLNAATPRLADASFASTDDPWLGVVEVSPDAPTGPSP